MPQMELPTSKFLNVAEWKKVLSKATTEKEKVCIILSPATEAKSNSEMIECLVHNKLVGDKLLYDFKNKFADLFDSYGNNTDNWVGKMIVPVCPDKESLFFVRFETKGAIEEKIAE